MNKRLKPTVTFLGVLTLSGMLLAGCGNSTPTTAQGTSSSGGTTANASSSGSGSTANATAVGSTDTSSAGASGGTITIDEQQDPAHLDPAVADDTTDWEYEPQFYDPLLTYKPGTLDLTGNFAKDWSISSDGKTYTFHLTSGVKFWNGDEATAQSVIDELQRCLDPNVGSPFAGYLKVIVGADAFTSGKAKTVSGLSAPDKNTLVIKLTKPETFFIKLAAMPFFSPVDMAYVNKIGNKAFDHQPMGTGPFELKSYTTGQNMVLTKNPNYFQAGVPKVDQINVDIVQNAQTSALRFQQGTTAFISWNQNIDAQDYVKMANSPQWKNDFLKQVESGTWYLALNNKVKPFDNKLVRQAVNMAIDKQRLVKLLNGRAVTTDQILPPTYPTYEKNLPSNDVYPYNPTKAKQLLAQAGFPNGFSTTIIAPSDSQSMQIVQSIQGDLKQVGIDATIKSLAGSSYISAMSSMKYPMDFTAWFQAFPDPYEFLDVKLNSAQIPYNNWSGYSNPTVDKELNQAASMPDGQARNDLYDKIQNQILADAPWVPLYNPMQYAVVQPWLKGFYLQKVLLDPLQAVSVTKH